jgi:hypothetical protein
MEASVAGLLLLVAPANVTKHAKEIPVVGRIRIASIFLCWVSPNAD